MFFMERVLDRVEFTVLRQAFDCSQIPSIGLNREQGTRLDGLAVQMDGAGTARSGIATDMGTGQVEILADKVD
jgi:hypothetical protein